MRKLLNDYFRLGTLKTPHYLHRSIILANQFALVMFLLTVLYISVLLVLTGLTPGILRIGTSLFFYPLIPALLHAGYHVAGRLLASCFIPVFIIILMTFASETDTPLIYNASYFPPRILAMATCIMPLFVFDTLREKKWITVALMICGICVLGYDYLLGVFGRTVEVYARPDLFLYYNLVFAIHFAMLTSSAFLMKRMTDLKDDENIQLMEELNQKNKSLETALMEQEMLNEEITAQTEELRTSQEKLREAYDVIEKQKEELHKYNASLEELVRLKSRDLMKANEELSKYNSELRQFSYTISHNLRAPVARLIGLSHLLAREMEGFTGEQQHMLKLLCKSTSDLDNIIRDLNKIIDIRNEIYGIKEKVNLFQEVSRILLTLKEQIPADAQIETRFEEAPYVYGVHPMINSILFNLISNAIKYRAYTRPLRLTLQSKMNGSNVVLTVTDNGLGINMQQFGKDLFAMYKRFHTHTDGKGLGLYLVKTQMELMGGKVEVHSELNIGTTFTLTFSKPADVEGQICFESEYGKIYFNARLNMCGITWKKQVTSNAYRDLFLQCLNMLRLYNTPFWMSDLRKLGQVAPEDQKWMLTTILPDAINLGLSHIAVIYDPAQHNDDYLKKIAANIHQLRATVKFFTTTNEAETWVESVLETLEIRPN